MMWEVLMMMEMRMMWMVDWVVDERRMVEWAGEKYLSAGGEGLLMCSNYTRQPRVTVSAISNRKNK